MEVEYQNDELSVSIKDDGIPFNPFMRDEPDTSLSLDDREIGGLGLHLVKQMMDEVSYMRFTDTNMVRLVIKAGAQD